MIHIYAATSVITIVMNLNPRFPPNIQMDVPPGQVEFRKDMMQIAGKEVEETRLTAWQGPQPFYYR